MKESNYIKKLKKKGLLTELDQAKDFLKEIGIEEIYALNELGDQPEEYNCPEKLSMLIIPLNTGVHQDSIIMKNAFKDSGLTNKKQYYPSYQEIEISDRETTYRNKFFLYLKNRNLIIAMCNPFYDQQIWRTFQIYLMDKQEEIEYLNPDDLIYQELADRMNKRTLEIIHQTDELIEDLNHDEQNARKVMVQSIQEREIQREIRGTLEKQLKNGKEAVKEQIKLLKENKLLKKVEIDSNGIRINFGEIYLHGKVQTGTNVNESKVEVPVVEIRKVYIGEMEVRIQGTNMRAYNKTQEVNGYAHPHVNHGGTMCLGAISEEVNDALIDMELIKFTKLIYSWIRSYNEEDCYTKLQVFYDKEQKEKEKAKQKTLVVDEAGQ